MGVRLWVVQWRGEVLQWKVFDDESMAKAAVDYLKSQGHRAGYYEL
jgi:DNA-binding LacI/PurR family transcriptional regulator